MPIPIPYALDYNVTASGAVLKLVRCEHCTAEYIYKLERSATGSGTSLLFLDNTGAHDRASTEAASNLRGKLERGVDVVPCPACGWVQSNMTPKARRQQCRWMLNVGATLAVVGVVAGLLTALTNGMLA